MRVPQVMRAYHGHPSLSECWPPDLIAEPVARDVTIGVADSGRAWIILPNRSPPRPVLSEGAPAMRTPTTSGRVRTQRSMPIGPPTGIRRGAAKEVRVRQHSQHWLRSRHGEDEVIVGQAAITSVCPELVSDLAGQLDPAVLTVLRVVLDEEPAAVWVELRVHFHHCPADCQHSGREVDVAHPQLGELAPAQAGLDLRLGKQPHRVVRQRIEDTSELLRGDDRARLLRHGGRLHTLAWVDEYDLVVQGSREDRAKQDLVVSDCHRGDACVLQRGYPGADVLGKDVDHPHGAERRHQVSMDAVRIALPGGRLNLMVGQPGLLHVGLKGLPAPAWVAKPTLGDLGLGPLPRLVRVALVRERSSRTLAASEVAVVRRVARAAVLAGPLAGELQGARLLAQDRLTVI